MLDPTNFISRIADDRGEELECNDVTISEILNEDTGCGSVSASPLFRRQLSEACTKFIETTLWSRPTMGLQ